MLGIAPVAIYVLCLQATQPIHGLGAAAFNFLFPHISSRHEAGEIHGPRRVFRLALLSSIGLALALALPLILFGKTLLTLWMGAEFAKQAYIVLGLLAVANAVLAVSVVPHYTLLALGYVRYVSVVNVLGGIVCLCAAPLLIPPLGLVGAALARLLYGPVVALNFVKITQALRRRVPACEEAVAIST
jgi:O-antigen/teichoic acid export membrane protein